jgi:hypothetical protein
MAMLPDCIAHDARGRRQAGVFTGLWTAGESLGLALGPGIFELLLQAFRYESSADGVTQSGTARLGIVFGLHRGTGRGGGFRPAVPSRVRGCQV